MRNSIHKFLAVGAIALVIASNIPASGAASPWGANYFPNVPLTTHEGENVHFFDDLIKDKVVAINFIYTRCPDTCPLETAQLVKVQQILSDRLGKDIFFYSISIDPKNDTPPVLAEYQRKVWRALDIFDRRELGHYRRCGRKLGLYIEEIQDGSNNHNVSMIIGNQATGRWMKRSPFENAHVLADQLGNWLTGWKAPPQRAMTTQTRRSCAAFPRGEQIYRTRCATCHSLTGHELAGALGPDLLGVTDRREISWILNWLRAPDQMLEQKDPIAMELYERYGKLAMPNLRLNQQEAEDIIDYMEERDSTDRIRIGEKYGSVTRGRNGQPTGCCGDYECLDKRGRSRGKSNCRVYNVRQYWFRRTEAGEGRK